MSRSKGTFGALISAALCLCAFSVAGASAANVEAHTCSNGPSKTGTERYTDSTCTARNDGTGAFGWEPIGAGKTKVSVANGDESSLEATIGGTFFRIACTGIEVGGEVENAAGRLVGSGIEIKYTGCAVTNPTLNRCKVKTTLETETLKAESKEMSVKYEPVGSTFIAIQVEQGTGPTCPAGLLMNAKEVTGSATAEVMEEGRTQAFTSTSGSALKLGGQTATYRGSNGLVMKGTSVAVGAVT